MWALVVCLMTNESGTIAVFWTSTYKCISLDLYDVAFLSQLHQLFMVCLAFLNTFLSG